MNEMSLRQAVEFWTYLHDQFELNRQAFINAPAGTSYKDEKRAETETYQGIAEKFVRNFEQSITSAENISHGLTAEQTAGFLNYLDEKITELKAILENTRRNREKALASAHDMEYSRVKSIYKDMENLTKDQIGVFENSRKRFMSLLQGE